MDTSALIKALTETLFISVGQATIIVLFFKVMFKAVPDIPSTIKFKLWYASLILIFMLFVFTLGSLYADKSNETLLVENNIKINGEKATFWDTLMFWEERYAGVIAFIYFAGVLVHMSILFTAWLSIRKFRQAHTLLNDSNWEMRFKALRIKAGVLKDVTLYLSCGITVPLTSGYLKPLILLPIGILNNLTPEQVEAILLHELAHIKRNDYLLNLFQRVIATILFFNPAVRILSNELKKEREYCCDDMVVDKNTDPLVYANALLKLEEQRSANDLILAANGNTKYPLLTRIRKFTTMRKTNSSPKIRLIALAAMFSIGISLAWVIPTVRRENIEAKVASKPVKVKIQLNPSLPDKADTNDKKVTSVKKTERKAIRAVDSTNSTHKNSRLPAIQKEIQETSGQIQKLVEEKTRFFDSEEWKQNQKDILKISDDIRKHFNSPEWKKIQNEMIINSQELAEHFDSPEWKKFHSELQINASNLAKNPNNLQFKKKQEELEKSIEQYNRKFNNEDWIKKQTEIERKSQELNKMFESPEWKQKQRDIEIKSEELVKKFQESPEWKSKLKDLEKKMNDLQIKMEELNKQDQKNN